MSDGSKIEWTEATWNPVTGCTKVSPGCDNCYAERIVNRFKGKGAFDKVELSEPKLSAPLKWRKPRRIFVNSMSDLFHDDVPDEFIARVWAVMAATPQHTYQILTKRHGRMKAFLNDICRCGSGHPPGTHLMSAMQWAATRGNPNWIPGLDSDVVAEATRGMTWGKVLPNVWLGVSVEDQKWADIRIPALLETPAAVRWLSCEPMLGKVSLRTGRYAMPPNGEVRGTSLDGIDWCVVGGESGPGARPMELGWAQFLVDQCQAASVPVFVKQLGSRWGKNHHDIDAFPESLRVREYPQSVKP